MSVSVCLILVAMVLVCRRRRRSTPACGHCGARHPSRRPTDERSISASASVARNGGTSRGNWGIRSGRTPGATRGGGRRGEQVLAA